MMSRMFIIYDGRACGGAGTDDAAVCDTATSDREARSRARSGDYGASVACFSYRTDQPGIMDDERWEWDWHEGSGFST